MTINLPNQITIARLGLAIVFFVLLAQYDQRAPQPWLLNVSTALFIIAAVTDVLDGYVARKYDQVTSLGRILDPFVDKVLVCGAFVLLAGPRFVNAAGDNVTGIAAWMVVLIFGRELLVTGLRGFSESAGRNFGANAYGKAKMWVQSITAPTVMWLVAHPGSFFGESFSNGVKLVLVWLTVIVTTVSMTSYLLHARQFLFASASRDHAASQTALAGNPRPAAGGDHDGSQRSSGTRTGDLLVASPGSPRPLADSVGKLPAS